MRKDPPLGRAAQRGSAIIEFALIVPLYFLLIFGCVQFAIVFFGYSNAAYASQVAVRYAVVHGTTTYSPCTSATLTNIVKPLLWGAPNGSVTVTTTWSPDESPGSIVTVRVQILYKTMIPFSSLSTVPVGASAQGTILY
jgi:Flp pilus assembly protein TadG